TVIVDEIHALAPNKRGAHLALSLERLEALCGRPLTRIGLSATQKPIEEVAKFLIGAPGSARHGTRPQESLDSGFRRNDEMAARGPPARGGAQPNVSSERPSPLAPRPSPLSCEIVDVGYSRRRDLSIELPSTPLQAVMSGDVWGEVYTRLAELIE